MITASAAALLLVTAPYGQTAPQSAVQTPPSSDITSSLNSGPPRPATYLAPTPATPPPAPVAAPAPAPAPTRAPTRPATVAPAAAPAPARP
ncbi:MAG: hypothetical protein SWI22_14125, partial [Pseudomonadota bacterium]|nr:hypothetical protein [Pseudomonadota bacterium]